MKEDNKVFYVYEWFNKNTGEVFYVGKGKGSRWKTIKNRNKYFVNYYNKHNCEVRKIKASLTEEESFKLEIEKISYYKDIGQCKCNLTMGGEGVSLEVESEDWYRQKFCFYDKIYCTNGQNRWTIQMEEAFEICGGYKECCELSYEDMVEIWEEYLSIKHSNYILEEMLMSDESFRDVWEGIC